MLLWPLGCVHLTSISFVRSDDDVLGPYNAGGIDGLYNCHAGKSTVTIYSRGHLHSSQQASPTAFEGVPENNDPGSGCWEAMHIEQQSAGGASSGYTSSGVPPPL